MCLSEQAVEGWRADARAGQGGQLRYLPLAIANVLRLHAVFRLILLQTDGLIGSNLQLLGFGLAIPDSR